MATVCESTELGVVIEVPKQFSKYTYVRTIGCASSSVVLLVSSRQGEHFAAKVVRRDSLTESSLEYFEREIRLLQLIQHPNIVRLYETIYDAQNIILVMEFCEFGDLFTYLSDNGALPQLRLRSWSFQILKALQCLHEKGFAHRDLKPENVLVCSENVVKLADFGLAGDYTLHALMTTLCGSLHYMAPEVIHEIPYDGMKADVWSFGIVLYAMALNRLPWRSQDSQGIAREIVHGTVNIPQALDPDVAGIIRACIKMEPRERPTAADLLETPWLSQEVVVYNRSMGLAGKLSVAQIHSGQINSVPAFPSITRNMAKVILNKPSLRPIPSDKRGIGGRVFVNLTDGI
jgi:serine/threonine protein kinase